MIWLIVWGAVIVGFLAGYVTCALLIANRERMTDVPSVEVTAISPHQMQRMGEALSHAGDMLKSGDFDYVSGGLIVQDLGHGVVTIRGDVSLRAKEYEAPKGRDFIGMKK